MPSKEITLKLRKYHKGQQDIYNHRNRFNVLMLGRRFGKTSMGEILAEDALLAAQLVGWFAPTYKILDGAWNSIMKSLKPVIAKKNKQERVIELINGGVIEFWSLQDEDAGRSRKYHRVIIDEAGLGSGLKHKWDSAIRPTLTDFGGDAWLLGTPKGQGDFHAMWLKGQNGSKNWSSWRKGTIDNPTIPNLAQELEDARREMPENVFNQEYLGIPDDNGGNPFGLTHIRQCVMPGIDSGMWSWKGPGTPVAFGIDLAKSYDYTVVIGLDANGMVCRFERWQGESWPQTIQRIQGIVGSTPAFVDSTGVGNPVLDELNKYGSNYEPFLFSQPSKQEIIEALAIAIQNHRIRVPDGVIVAELESFGYEYSRSGRVIYSAPQGLHDDCVYALAMALKMSHKPQLTYGTANPKLYLGF